MFDGGSVVDERLKKQLAFILELDKIKKIGRQTYLSDASRKENDAEHSWHLAIMAVLLAEQANEKIDVLKTVTMVLIHDVVEIDAGDTFAYDSAGNESKREREERAADRIFNILPPDQAKYMRELWEEFEARETAEAKFADTLDHVQPLLLNDASKGLSWREHEIKKSQVMKRNEKIGEGSDALWEYARGLIQKNTELGNLKNE
ncbi:MAG: HD domain-containing protein [Clostridium sp.]|nr:HD domain-containing protein [Clostridium sp.]MCM1172492.1 HD domain-containing protein [Clostridium sp.]MCM1207480.1 HD domain-containing protein [Ruminococcus sp.]MCM1287333.1 HD domain-containing protein [Clostridium sp.]